jgi:metal-dependent HD superfamily phosphatase/phosphodiesterase
VVTKIKFSEASKKMEPFENYSEITVSGIKKNPIVDIFIKSSDDYLGVISYTEHGHRRVGLVSSIASNILMYLEYPKHLQQLAGIAEYLHDIGNAVNRMDLGQSSALIAMRILKDMGATPYGIALMIYSMGNHEEEMGDPVNAIAAALILADKSDVRETRGRKPEMSLYDIHDRVNLSAKKSFLRVSKKKKRRYLLKLQ